MVFCFHSRNEALHSIRQIVWIFEFGLVHCYQSLQHFENDLFLDFIYN